MESKVAEPLVSIVLPTYNGRRYLRKSIDSCLSQSYKNIEIIAVNDGSTDDTLEILKSYKDNRVKILDIPNGGLPNALNVGFRAASGRYLTWTSDDNYYLPNAINEMVEYLNNNPNKPLVYAIYNNIDENDKIIGQSKYELACFLYRKEIADITGEYRIEFKLVEDVDFFLRLRHAGGVFGTIKKVLYHYRIHGGSLSSRKICERQLISLKMHYDLISRGIKKGSLEDLFFDRLRITALYRDMSTMNEIVTFANKHELPFAIKLQNKSRFLNTKIGWFVNRVYIFVYYRIKKLVPQRSSLLE
ncbi:MAG: glycosyltransferase [Fibrobacteres bacterium]|nr:glycosyltransferase [Fibrobacterota bacterium]